MVRLVQRKGSLSRESLDAEIQRVPRPLRRSESHCGEMRSTPTKILRRSSSSSYEVHSAPTEKGPQLRRNVSSCSEIQSVPTATARELGPGYKNREVRNALNHDRCSIWDRLLQNKEAHSLKTLKYAQHKAATTMLIKCLSGGAGKMSRAQIKRIYTSLKSLDVDGSGDIDYHEFIAGLDMEDTATAKKMFKDLDRNGDGAISVMEIVELISGFASVEETDMPGTTDEQRLKSIVEEVEAEQQKTAASNITGGAGLQAQLKGA
eukprot:TRINITY_DN84823_c0_g1_i1.p1 TRINITY_DN84823_c0_g1~~TRINITY_DN84823_c0_g1_i1.p1  ORF type:complete len:263 (+),score=44.79 TRINITY_DN84823_c0_g1_i1:61-849(+)